MSSDRCGDVSSGPVSPEVVAAVRVADVEPFAAIVKDATALVNELNQPTFDLDVLPPTAVIAYQNLARALGVLSRRGGWAASPHLHARCIQVRGPVDAEEREAMPTRPDTRQSLLAQVDAVPAEELRGVLADVRAVAAHAYLGGSPVDALRYTVAAIQALLPGTADGPAGSDSDAFHL